MRVYLFLILGVVLFCLGCFSEHRAVYTRMMRFGDSLPGTGWTQQMFDSIGMKQVKNTNKQFYFRFGIEGESVAVDIWSDDMVNYHAQLFCYIHNEYKKKTRYFGMAFPLGDSIANRIVHLFNDLGIAAITDVEAMQGYNYKGIRNDTIVIYELLNAGKYTYKVYAGSHVFFSIEEAKRIDSFSNYIYTSTGMSDTYDKFIDYLPDGVYNKGKVAIVKYPYN